VQFESDVLVAGLDQVCLEVVRASGESCDYYDVLGDGTSVIDGSYGPGQTGCGRTEVRRWATRWQRPERSDGYYAIVVKPAAITSAVRGAP